MRPVQCVQAALFGHEAVVCLENGFGPGIEMPQRAFGRHYPKGIAQRIEGARAQLGVCPQVARREVKPGSALEVPLDASYAGDIRVAERPLARPPEQRNQGREVIGFDELPTEQIA
jgi:hypothetical protein